MSDRGRTDKALRWIGELDHPFYDDERQRFIWYEASAIGFQLLLLLQYFAAGVALLVWGAPALPFMWALLAPLLITVFVIVAYCARRGAKYFPGRSDLGRGRYWLAIGVTLVLIAGLVRAGLDRSDDAPGSESDGFWGGFTSVLSGGSFGLAMLVGLLAGVVAASLSKNKSDGDFADWDDDED